MAILLIRHGETAANARRVVQRPDVPLNERGLAQARRLGARLADMGVGELISSDHERASMTAREIQLATGARLSWDEGLRERSFGDLRGRAYADIDADIFAPTYSPPNGETWAEFDARVDATWDRLAPLAQVESGHLGLVTHGLFCRSLVSRRLDLSRGFTPVLAFANTSLTVIAADPPWVVERLNCSEHLSDEGAPSIGGLRA